MKSLICLFGIAIALFASLSAQNLVPNPSFETYSGCGGNSAISNGTVTSWNRPPGSIITPDLFTNCATSGTSCTDFNVANNCVGSSTPFHATAYAGQLWYYTGCPNCKEYIHATLTSPCVAGTVYRASYRTKLGNLCRYGTNRHAMYISTTAPSQPGGNQPILITPTVERAGTVLDKVNWTLISGTFTAVAGQQFVTIGNFYNDASTTIFDFGSSSGVCIFGTGAAYYMIDSVNVRPAVILPVDVRHFAGESQSTGNLLSWDIAPAAPLAELWLEHSTDGVHYSTIAEWRSPAAAALHSQFLHVDAPEGVNLYRLGMADRNGEFMVSEVVTLENGRPQTLEMTLLPNPAHEMSLLRFLLPQPEKGFSVQVLNLEGAEVWQTHVPFAQSQVELELPLQALPAGVYMVQVRGTGTAGAKRLVVVH